MAKLILPLLFVIMAAAAASDMSPDPEADAFIQQADEKVSKFGTIFYSWGFHFAQLESDLLIRIMKI